VGAILVLVLAQSALPLQAFGVFGLCQIHAFVDYVRSRLTHEQFTLLLKTIVMVVGGAAAVVGGVLTATGESASFIYLMPLYSHAHGHAHGHAHAHTHTFVIIKLCHHDIKHKCNFSSCWAWA